MTVGAAGRTTLPLSDLAGRLFQSARSVSIAVLVVLALAASAQAAKPNIRVEQSGHNWLRITFIAPAITSRETRYFVRFQTVPQEGCSWKATSVGQHGRPGQTVKMSLVANWRQGREYCVGPAKVTVFLQRSHGGLVAKDATAQTFRLVGTVRFVVG